MEHHLSFEPRYHEIPDGQDNSTWVPMYNPARDCVKAECRQIEEEGGRVNSRAWKMLPQVRQQNWLHTLQTIDALLIWLLVGFFMGDVLTTRVFHINWAMQLSWPAHVAVATTVGMAVLFGLWGLIEWCIKRKSPRADPTEATCLAHDKGAAYNRSPVLFTPQLMPTDTPRDADAFTIPAEIATCLRAPATNAARGQVLTWLKSHAYDSQFWLAMPEQVADDLASWASKSRRWLCTVGIVVWFIALFNASLGIGALVMSIRDLGPMWSIGLGVVAMLATLIGGVLFSGEWLFEPWTRACNCEKVESILHMVGPVANWCVEKELYVEVRHSPAAVKYLDEVRARRKYIWQDVAIAQKLTPGYVPLFD